MATATHPVAALLTMEQYLATSFHPDCDFVDGVLVERNLGEYEHNNMQAALVAWFFNNGPEWNIRVLPEQRTRIAEGTIRIPDVCIVPRDGVIERVRVTPPLLCIEIQSPGDWTSRSVRVLDDYLAMGVPNLWYFDPVDRVAFTYKQNGPKLFHGDVLSIPESPIYVNLNDLFASLD